MKHNLITAHSGPSLVSQNLPVPPLIASGGERASYRFVEFFTACIRNRNTRRAYSQAVAQFCLWCEDRKLVLHQINSVVVAAYIEELCGKLSRPTVKQHLAALRMLFDWLVTGHVLETNPASSVRGPKYVLLRGKTPVLSGEEARSLLSSIQTKSIGGLRDRALMAAMVYSFARIGAILSMNVGDYFQQGKRFYLRLHEKGGKEHVVPVHHKAEEYLDQYVSEAGIESDLKSPLFRTLDRRRELTDRRLQAREALAMVKRRSRDAGPGDHVCCHSFRATGITCYLQSGGTLENAQLIAAHSSPRTTKLYDRTSDEITLDEIERIAL